MLKLFTICIALLSVCNVLVSVSSSPSLVDDIFNMNSQIQNSINSMISSASTGTGTGSSISSYSSGTSSGSSSGSVSTSTMSGTDSDGNSYTTVTQDTSDGKYIHRVVTTTYQPSGKTKTTKTTIKI